MRKEAFTVAPSGAGPLRNSPMAHTFFSMKSASFPRKPRVALLRRTSGTRFERAEGSRSISVDVRFILIAATNRDLSQPRCRPANMRSDLFYRLNFSHPTFPAAVRVPKIFLCLVISSIEPLFRKSAQDITAIDKRSLELNKAITLPGKTIRELHNVIARFCDPK